MCVGGGGGNRVGRVMVCTGTSSFFFRLRLVLCGQLIAAGEVT